MMLRRVRFVIVGLAVIAASLAQAQAPSSFRAGVDAVTIDLSVFNGNNAVAGLTAADFTLTDNGVKQDVQSLDVEALPIDLTLVLDASGSVAEETERMRSDTRTIAQNLKRLDTVRLLTFAALVSAPLGLEPGRDASALPFAAPGGSTSFNHALVSALIAARRTGTADRRQLIVALTDASDNSSFLDSGDVRAVAATSDAVLHLFVIRKSGTSKPSTGWLPHMDGWTGEAGLRLAVEQTGGQYYDSPAITDVPATVAQVVDVFRTSYVLRYVAAGVSPGGWHDVLIRVNKPGKFIVRAKKGYLGGAGR